MSNVPSGHWSALMQCDRLFRDAAGVLHATSTLRSVHILCSATVRHTNSDKTVSEFRCPRMHRRYSPRPPNTSSDGYRLPSDDTNHCSSRLKLRLVSARVTPATARNSESIFSSRSIFCSTEMENGSIVMRSGPLGSHRFLRRELDVVLLHLGRSAGNLDRSGSGGFYAGTR